MSQQNVHTQAAHLVLEKSTRALNVGAANLQKVLADILSVSEASTPLILQIEDKEKELKSLEETFDLRQRSLTAEFNVRLQEDKLITISQVLQENNKVAINKDELSDLRATLQKALKDNNTEVENAVKQAVLTLEQNHKILVNDIISKHSVEVAEDKALITSLQQQVEYLSETVASLKEDAREERTARVATAQALGGLSSRTNTSV